MKKALHCTIACLFLAFAANAQVLKNTVLLGGGFSYSKINGTSSQSTAESPYRQFTVNPAVGVAVKENLIVGIATAFAGTKQSFIDGLNLANNETKSNGGGVFIRKYTPIIKQLMLYTQSEALFSIAKNTSEYSSPNAGKMTSRTNINRFDFNFNPGVACPLHKNFHIEAGLGNIFNLGFGTEHVKVRNNLTVDEKKRSFNIGTSLSGGMPWNLGFRLLLPR